MQAWLRERNAYSEQPCEADVQVVLGGDGMVVRAARSHCEVPVLGIDFGQFGFLAHVPRSRWETRLKQVLVGRYDVRVDSTIRVDLERAGQPLCSLWAVQDVVFHAFVVPGGGQQMALLELYIDNKYLNPLPGDGLIIATSPGSSAYNLAAGGPVLAPGSQTFAVTPICAHTPMRASFSVAESTPITLIQLGRFPISVCVDGQESFDEFAPNDVAHIAADPRRFQLVTLRTPASTVASDSDSTTAFGRATRSQACFTTTTDLTTSRRRRPRSARRRAPRPRGPWGRRSLRPVRARRRPTGPGEGRLRAARSRARRAG
jgi:NAD+ kinase